MGKRIKSTGVILDASSMASAPVSPAGTVALRAKSDSTQFQYSANGGAWTDFGAGGGGGTVRLDQVLDPDIPATEPPTNRVKAFSMTDHSLVFSYTATQSEECFVIVSTEPVTQGAAGALLLLRANGATTEKNPLRIEARGVFVMTVNADGKVAIGRETGLANKLTIEHTNTGADETGGIQCSVFLAAGNTATSTNSNVFTLTDDGNTTALTELRVLSLALARTSAAAANVPLFTYIIDARAYFSANTGVAYGLYLKPTMSNAATLTHWVGIHVETPSLLAGGVITNSKAIITAPGAGNVGFGTLSPAVQLHVAGGVEHDQSVGQWMALYKYSGTSGESPTIVFASARGTGAGSESPLVATDGAGAIVFTGWLSTSYSQYGYVRSYHGGGSGAVVEIGAGALDQSRVMITETGSAGSVTLFGGSTNYFQVQTAGFQFSHGATGSTYYRSAAGYFVDLAIGTVGQVWTVTDTGGGVLLPRWAAAPGGGGSAPGGSASELQYRAGASTFGAVSNSAVSGANVTLGGTLSLDAAGSLDQSIVLSALSASDTKITFTEYRGAATPILLQFDRSRGTQGSPTNLSSDDIIGELKFRGRVSGAFAQLGYLRGAYSSIDGGVVQLGAGATSGSGTRFVATVNSGAGIFDTGGNFFTVSGSGFQFSHGGTGAIYYRSALGLFTALTIGSTSQYLKGGTIPSWGSLDAGHITSGTLALANGGTGQALTDPGGDRILFWDDSAGAVTWLTAGTGLTITTTTMTASGGTPGGATNDIQYRTAAPAFGGITPNTGGLLMGIGTGSPPLFTTTFSAGVRYNFSPSSTIPGLNVGSLASGSNPSAPANGDIYYNSTAGKFRAYQSSAWVDLISSPAGSGSELQYRNAGAFGAVLSSSVDGSGVITHGSGATIWTSDSAVLLSYRLYNSTATSAPTFSVLRSRGSVASKSGVLAGDALFIMPIYGQYDSVGQRQGGQLGFDVQSNYSTSSAPTVFRLKTAHQNSITPNERLLIGGSKSLTDNTLTDLFSVTFAAADQLVVGGEIHMLITAKQVSGSIQTQVYHRKMHFVFGHNGATTSSAVDIRLDSGVGTNQVASSGGFSQLQHAINSSGASDMTSAITLGTLSDTLTYKVLFNSDITTFSQFTIYYHIIYHGEKDIVLL